MAKRKSDNQHELPLQDTIGVRLRHAREALQINAEDIADQLCLSYGVIQDIENDNYFAEKNTIFMRGYIRAYARFVKVPAYEIQRALEEIGLVEPAEKAKPVKFQFKERTPKDKAMRITTHVVITALVALVFVWWYLHR